MGLVFELLPWEGVVIVTRHVGAALWIAAELGGEFMSEESRFGTIRLLEDGWPIRDIPVLSSVRPSEIEGKVVIGNLPLSLAAKAKMVFAVEFEGPPPRGAEYGEEEMRAAGARLRPYRVELLKEELDL